LIHEKSPKRERKEKIGPAKKKGDTHAESFRLYKEGKNISEIAKERNLTSNTIEGHLAKFVRCGDISIHELVSREKFILIESALKDFDGASVIPVKQKLGEGISYGAIKLVMASLGVTQHHSEEGK
jgi:ATP-dependent DNA helicase RecQ